MVVKEVTEQTLQRTREVGSLSLAASLAAELGVGLTRYTAVVKAGKESNLELITKQ
jgi:hypothetical protein